MLRNIRRGNTILEDRTNNKFYWGRFGLEKFFDLRREYLPGGGYLSNQFISKFQTNKKEKIISV